MRRSQDFIDDSCGNDGVKYDSTCMEEIYLSHHGKSDGYTCLCHKGKPHIFPFDGINRIVVRTEGVNLMFGNFRVKILHSAQNDIIVMKVSF